MPITFPSLVPTSRSFKPPSWPATKKTSQAGVTSIRLWGSRPSDGGMSLTFANIPDADAAAILNAHRAAKGHVLPIVLPNAVLKGMEQELADAFLAPISEGRLSWHFSENDPPTTDSVIPGRSTVRVILSAELRLA